ncbi:hypothetical protein RyT2_08040 [Pseudolactococcus yaeyamensis]
MKPNFEIKSLGHNMYQIYGAINGMAESFMFEGLLRFKYEFSFFTPKGIYHKITWNGNMTIGNLDRLETHIIEAYERAVEEER